tara:strand:- start:563 stop:706 length:144 start_codon:yes stop_codon:yes gene_type:complete
MGIPAVINSPDSKLAQDISKLAEILVVEESIENSDSGLKISIGNTST